MSLTILGTHAGDVWVETRGDLYPLSTPDLARMRDEVRKYGTTSRAGILFDEQDVTELILALTGPVLDDCRWCEKAGVSSVEGYPACLGHAAGYGLREEESA